MSVISGSRSLLTARVTKDGTVLEVTREQVLFIMAKDTELGDILMGAFVARRLLMIQLGEGNVVLFSPSENFSPEMGIRSHTSILMPSPVPVS